MSDIFLLYVTRELIVFRIDHEPKTLSAKRVSSLHGRL